MTDTLQDKLDVFTKWSALVDDSLVKFRAALVDLTILLGSDPHVLDNDALYIMRKLNRSFDKYQQHTILREMAIGSLRQIVSGPQQVGLTDTE